MSSQEGASTSLSSRSPNAAATAAAEAWGSRVWVVVLSGEDVCDPGLSAGVPCGDTAH